MVDMLSWLRIPNRICSSLKFEKKVCKGVFQKAVYCYANLLCHKDKQNFFINMCGCLCVTNTATGHLQSN